MRALWMSFAFGVAACGRGKEPAKRADAAPPAPVSDCTPGPDLLDRCSPCGVSWAPLIALSSYDPEAPPADLPGPDAVWAILDACQATCAGTARTEVTELLRGAQDGRAPAAPWRKLAERCPAALALDDHTRRFARGTWYALDRAARALPPGASVELPLPPFSQASTALALPRVERLADWTPRVHLTITDQQVHVGVLPWVEATPTGLALVPGPGLDYPGDAATDVPAAVDGVRRALAGSGHAADADTRPVAIAPRGLRVARLLEAVHGLPAIHLAATARTPRRGLWPEMPAAIPTMIADLPALSTRQTIDLSIPGAPVPDRIAAIDPIAPEVQLVLAASVQVADLAIALDALAGRGVQVAGVTLSPTTSP